MLEKNRNNIGDTFCTNKKISKICRVMHYAIVTLKNLKFRKTIVKNSSQDSNVIIGHIYEYQKIFGKLYTLPDEICLHELFDRKIKEFCDTKENKFECIIAF